MTFEHAPVDLPQLDRVDSHDGRRYVTPEGNAYPSITTVLSILSEDSIKAWRKRVGDEEADKISYRASTRGTAVHECVEKYLQNTPMSELKKLYTPNIIESFLSIKGVLDERIGKIFSQECGLYSDHLQCAGTVDCVAEFDGKISIIDFKTSRKIKKRKYITNYFAQESGYAVMWEERTRMPITQLVTIIAVDDMHGAPGNQVFVEHRDNFINLLRDTIEEYDSRSNPLFA